VAWPSGGHPGALQAVGVGCAGAQLTELSRRALQADALAEAPVAGEARPLHRCKQQTIGLAVAGPSGHSGS